MAEAICTKCKELKEIDNIKFMVCADCNDHKPKEKKWKPIKKVSEQGAKRNALKKAAYKIMDETADHICSGCGSGSFPLSHSHIIPVSLRKDLENDPENIVYDCLSIGEHRGCHDIWEHGELYEKEMLLNYQERIKIILKKDKKYFNQMLPL